MEEKYKDEIHYVGRDANKKTLTKASGLVIFGIDFDIGQTLCYAQQAAGECLTDGSLTFFCMTHNRWVQANAMSIKCIKSNTVSVNTSTTPKTTTLAPTTTQKTTLMTKPTTTTTPQTNGDTNSFGCQKIITIKNHGIRSLADPITLHQDNSHKDELHYHSPQNPKSTLYFSTPYKIWMLGEDYDATRAGCYSAAKTKCPRDVPSFICMNEGKWKVNPNFSFV